MSLIVRDLGECDVTVLYFHFIRSQLTLSHLRRFMGPFVWRETCLCRSARWLWVNMKFRFQIVHILAFGSMLWKRAVLHEYLARDRILSIMCKSIFAETLACIERPLTGPMADNSRLLAHLTMTSIVQQVAVHGTDVTKSSNTPSLPSNLTKHLYIFQTIHH